jgi:hypothetical protein
MLEPFADDIDYENMDDLPLFDHIEWICPLSTQNRNEQHYFLECENI